MTTLKSGKRTRCRQLYLAATMTFLVSVSTAQVAVESPSGDIAFTLHIDSLQRAVYSISYNDEPIVNNSMLGLHFADQHGFDGGLAIKSTTRRQVDRNWQQPWGEQRQIREHYNELAIELVADEPVERRLIVRVRVFDDGVGFRYEVPEQDAFAALRIVDELTEFQFTENATAWWIPGRRFNRYEYLYESGPLETVETAHTPMTVRLASGVHVALHEAALTDYAAYVLDQRRPRTFATNLTPWSDGVRVYTRAPFETPWRTVQIAPSAAALADSRLILNLNEPNVLGDVSWVRPGKYVGIWWGMHIRTHTWASGDKHGATNQETRRYIDFAADNGFAGVLVEGWNVGWDGDWFHNGDVMDFLTPYPDFNLAELAAYARERGVHLIGHHETSGSISNYNAQMAAAYDLYERVGVEQIKTGYVADAGDIKRHDEQGIARYEWHDGQFMVREYLRSVTEAAKRRISINTHEPIKDTGLRRTYPNWLSREGARGQEFNAWGDPPNNPGHTAILPYTRLLAGPMDFTPGVFDVAFAGAESEQRVPTTLAKQLALYVVIYSPVQMAADLIDNYVARPDAFQFIRDVPVDWEQSRTLAGEVGTYIVTARQERDSTDWFIGALTNEVARTVRVDLGFLEPNRQYTARIYRDDETAHWRHKPTALVVESRTVSANDVLELWLAPGGGAAVSLHADGDKR
ncbi:MAG: glycoside hydrolase family 97 protein [Pseudomonadota bacterium]